MLDVLRAKDPPPTLRTVMAPMQDFDLAPERFRLVFSAFRAVPAPLHGGGPARLSRLHAPRPRSRRRAWRSTSSRPISRASRSARSRSTRRVASPTADDEIVRVASVRRDHATQTQDVTMRLERRRDGALVGAEIERFRMRWYHRYELEHLLARAGFEIVALYGGLRPPRLRRATRGRWWSSRACGPTATRDRHPALASRKRTFACCRRSLRMRDRLSSTLEAMRG